jgi:hypothetical protein
VLLADIADAFVIDWADGNEIAGDALGADVVPAHTLVDGSGQLPDLVDVVLGYQGVG